MSAVTEPQIGSIPFQAKMRMGSFISKLQQAGHVRSKIIGHTLKEGGVETAEDTVYSLKKEKNATFTQWNCAKVIPAPVLKASNVYMFNYMF